MRLIARSLVRTTIFFFKYIILDGLLLFLTIFFCFLSIFFVFNPMSEDNFNLYGLRNEIPHFRSCLNVILDIADHSMDPKTEASLDQHVMDLYGLIHARYILTKRGMDRMVSVVSSSYCKAMLCCVPRVL